MEALAAKEEKKGQVVAEKPAVPVLIPVPAPAPKFDKMIPLTIELEGKEKEMLEKTVMTAFRIHSVERDIATFIKGEYDREAFPTWHCIVGKFCV